MTKLILSCLLFVFLNNCSKETKSNGGESNKTISDLDKEETSGEDTGNNNETKEIDLPYYFIAIHNEPAVHAGAMEAQYKALQKIIQGADEYKIKLTLMFGTTWADYINNSATMLAEFNSWKANGHEISSHHHALKHPGFWDGYAPMEEQTALQIRGTLKPGEKFLGSLEDFGQKISELDSTIKSGCLNEEEHKDEMANQIVISTCSGYKNSGVVGDKKADGAAGAGINDYVLVGSVNNIKRRWLSHAQVMSEVQLTSAKKDLANTAKSSVFGAVTHSLLDANIDQVTPIINYMKILHEKDPTAKKSKTLSQIIEEKILPEKDLPNH